MHKWSTHIDRLDWVIPLFLLTIHTGLVVGLALLIDSNMAVVVTSIVALTWSLLCYFRRQKFATSVLDSPPLVYKHPRFYPTITFILFVTSCVAVVMFGGWIWLILPFSEWFAMGFTCAELAIRRYIADSRNSGHECNRERAIFAIHYNTKGLKPSDLFQKTRYPFP